MARETDESTISPRDHQRLFFRWLVANGSGDVEELELSLDELQEVDPELAEKMVGKDGRSKTKKWVLLR
ncbi:MAG: hypothetical protein ACE5HA_01710 [Anaerolineae bacterium]